MKKDAKKMKQQLNVCLQKGQGNIHLFVGDFPCKMAASYDNKVLSDVHVYHTRREFEGHVENRDVKHDYSISRFFFHFPSTSPPYLTRKNLKNVSSCPRQNDIDRERKSFAERRQMCDGDGDLVLKRKRSSRHTTFEHSCLQSPTKKKKCNSVTNNHEHVHQISCEGGHSVCSWPTHNQSHSRLLCLEMKGTEEAEVDRKLTVQKNQTQNASAFECELCLGEPDNCRVDSNSCGIVTQQTDEIQGTIKETNFNHSQHDDVILPTGRSCCCSESEIYGLDVITIEHKMETILDDVGFQVWGGALLLCDYLIYQGANLNTEDAIVLDLGAGSGITSLVAAMFAPTIFCTDYRVDIVKQAERNWNRNKWNLPQLKCKDMKFGILDWTKEFLESINEESEYAMKTQDKEVLKKASLILAAEVIYDEDLTDAFFKTIYYLLLHPPEKNILIAVEKRVVFTSEDKEVCGPAYQRFQENLADLVTVDEGPVEFSAVKIDTNFRQFFQYNRTKEMKLWQVSSKFLTVAS